VHPNTFSLVGRWGKERGRKSLSLGRWKMGAQNQGVSVGKKAASSTRRWKTGLLFSQSALGRLFPSSKNHLTYQGKKELERGSQEGGGLVSGKLILLGVEGGRVPFSMTSRVSRKQT